MLSKIIKCRIQQSIISFTIARGFMISNDNPDPVHPTSAAGDLSYLPSKYSKAMNNYTRVQMKGVIGYIASISRTCSYSSLYPICKILKAISKIYMLNEIEIIFLAYLIRETSWDIRDKTIFHNAENVQDIIYCSNDSLDYKRIILYLMVTAYTVKFYLNGNTADILDEATKRCPNFKQIFQSWNKKHSTIITKINPRTLNIVYKKLYSTVQQDLPDFNMMVDAIIQISPAYNPEREKQNPDLRKKAVQKKEVEVLFKKEDAYRPDKSGLLNVPVALFSSSGLLNMMSLHNQHNQQPPVENNQSHSSMNPFMLGKSDTFRQDYLGILRSSVIGGIEGSNLDVNQEDDCGELVVGLHDGQSEENIIFEDKGGVGNSALGFQAVNPNITNNSISILNAVEETPYYTSIINLTRRSSIGAKQKMGTSEVFLNVNATQDINNQSNQNKIRREASVVRLDDDHNDKDKEKEKEKEKVKDKEKLKQSRQ